MTKKKLLLNFAFIALGLAAFVATPSGRAFAANASEEFWNLNDGWNISWGVKKVGIYASSTSNYVRVFINNVDTLFITSTGASITGNLSVTGATTLSGTLTQPGNNVEAAAGTSTLLAAGTAPTSSSVLGLFATPSVSLGVSGQNTGVNVSTVIPVNASYELLISSGGSITLTSTPSIATTTTVGGSTLIADGTWLVLGSTDTHIIRLQSNGTLSGSFLKLGAATRDITQFKDITLRYSAASAGGDGFWHEVAYSSDAN